MAFVLAVEAREDVVNTAGAAACSGGKWTQPNSAALAAMATKCVAERGVIESGAVSGMRMEFLFG